MSNRYLYPLFCRQIQKLFLCLVMQFLLPFSPFCQIASQGWWHLSYIFRRSNRQLRKRWVHSPFPGLHLSSFPGLDFWCLLSQASYSEHLYRWRWKDHHPACLQYQHWCQNLCWFAQNRHRFSDLLYKVRFRWLHWPQRWWEISDLLKHLQTDIFWVFFRRRKSAGLRIVLCPVYGNKLYAYPSFRKVRFLLLVCHSWSSRNLHHLSKQCHWISHQQLFHQFVFC